MNNNSKTIIRGITVFCVLLLSQFGFAQKNNIYIDVGTIVFEVNTSIHYERKVLQTESYLNQIYAHGSLGWSYFVGDPENRNIKTKYASLSGMMLFGNNTNRFFELSFGVLYADSSSKTSGFNSFLPISNVGYRWISNDLLFRTGLGFPEFLYFGVGLRF